MALAPGTRLEPYEILALIGAGGMGEVYRTRDTRLDRIVAIKILSQRFYDPARKQRFEREARAISCPEPSEYLHAARHRPPGWRRLSRHGRGG